MITAWSRLRWCFKCIILILLSRLSLTILLWLILIFSSYHRLKEIVINLLVWSIALWLDWITYLLLFCIFIFVCLSSIFRIVLSILYFLFNLFKTFVCYRFSSIRELLIFFIINLFQKISSLKALHVRLLKDCLFLWISNGFIVRFFSLFSSSSFMISPISILLFATLKSFTFIEDLSTSSTLKTIFFIKN